MSSQPPVAEEREPEYQKFVVFVNPEQPPFLDGRRRYRITIREKVKHPTMTYAMIVENKLIEEQPEQYLALFIAQHLRAFNKAIKESEPK